MLTEAGLSVDFLAQSAYRAHRFAYGLPDETLGWEGLSIERQEQWLKTAKLAETILKNCEGLSYQAAAAAIYLAWDENKAEPDDPIAWEAVTRHLTQLLDAYEEVDDFKDRKSTRLNSSHIQKSRMPSSA